MVEVGIPVYKARETICDALNSLVSQTRKQFLVCLSIDGEADDYLDIIKKYQSLGLNIRTIWGENAGPGMARQRIIDTTQCEYLIFLDSDDMLMPQAVENLYKNAKLQDYDVMRSGFIREEVNKQDLVFPHDINTVTWCHGKIYKVSYLKENNIRFHEHLRADEDSYFNLIAWNCAPKRGSIDQVTYYWRFNKASITRKSETQKYFGETYLGYITSQIEGLKEIYRIKNQIPDILITFSLINVYDYYMQAKFYKLDEAAMDKIVKQIKDEPWLKEFFTKGQNWLDISKNVKATKIIDDKYIIFYEENFVIWSKRVFEYGQ